MRVCSITFRRSRHNHYRTQKTKEEISPSEKPKGSKVGQWGCAPLVQTFLRKRQLVPGQPRLHKDNLF